VIRVFGCAATIFILSGCAGTAPDKPPAPVATSDVSVAPSGDMAHLVSVRLTPRSDADELEFEFTDRIPGYTVGYRPLPAHADGSGAEIPLPGAAALVEIAFNPATGAGWGGGEPTYTGPAVIDTGTEAVTEVKAAGDFEAVLTWVAGLRATVPFAVRTLDKPPRLVVEFRH